MVSSVEKDEFPFMQFGNREKADGSLELNRYKEQRVSFYCTGVFLFFIIQKLITAKKNWVVGVKLNSSNERTQPKSTIWFLTRSFLCVCYNIQYSMFGKGRHWRRAQSSSSQVEVCCVLKFLLKLNIN